MPTGTPEIKNHLVFAIISTVLFWPVGLFAIIKSTQVKSNLTIGNFQGASESSKSAKTLALIATIIGGLSWLLSIVALIFTLVISSLAVGSVAVGISELANSNAPTMITEDTEVELSATAVGEGSAIITIVGGDAVYQTDTEQFSDSFSATVTVPASGYATIEVSAVNGGAVSCAIVVDGTTVSSDNVMAGYCSTL